jgi:hypothetical protein
MVTLLVIRALAGIHRRRRGSLRQALISWRAMDRGLSQDHHLQKRRQGSPGAT